MFTLENIETALPGVITAVSDGTVDCKICIRKVAPNGVIDLQNFTLPKIPLMKLGGGNCEITFPSKVGDQVLLVALSRDSELWKKDYSDDVIPESSSGLTLSDFVAVPFIATKKTEGTAKIRVTNDGDIVFTPASGKKTIVESDVVFKGKLQATDDIVAGVTEVGDEIVETSAVHLLTHIHPTAVGPSSSPTPGT